ncbi:MAG: DUF4093 domain-containing protein [Clostridia bacterium]|nr:DUF4093 domain-containing protein [Clostridia bacterium]
MDKLKIPYPVIVEGKYDRLRLLSVMDGTVLTTDGFGLFKKNEKAALFRALAARTKIIVLTDPDGAGTLIRAHLSGILPKDRVIPLYVPALPGKEKRKSAPSAAGLLGVEGQERETLWHLLAPFSLCAPDNLNQKAKNNACTPITKADFFEDGLTGQKNAALRRDALAAAFSLPPGMTPNALLSALNILTTREGYREKLKNL